MAQTSNTMLATLAFTSASVLKAPLALRGGMTIAGVEPEQVATGLNALLAVQGLMMTQNQGKIHEVYGVKPTPITELFTENGGGILVGFAIAATLVLGGTDAAEAVGYGNIPNLLQNIKDFVGGTADKNGWGAGQVRPARRQRLLRRAPRQGRCRLDRRRPQGLRDLEPRQRRRPLRAARQGDGGLGHLEHGADRRLLHQALRHPPRHDGRVRVPALGRQVGGRGDRRGVGGEHRDVGRLALHRKDAPGDEDKGRFWLAVGAVGSAAMLLQSGSVRRG